MESNIQENIDKQDNSPTSGWQKPLFVESKKRVTRLSMRNAEVGYVMPTVEPQLVSRHGGHDSLIDRDQALKIRNS